jgi:hypothetical protein
MPKWVAVLHYTAATSYCIGMEELMRSFVKGMTVELKERGGRD